MTLQPPRSQLSSPRGDHENHHRDRRCRDHRACRRYGPSQTISSNDPLLAEVRALRAELNQAAGASIRTQLLVARLTLQEQRINTISKQLADVQTMRTGNDVGVAQMASRQGQIEERLRGQLPSDIRQQLEGEVAGMKGPLGQMRQRSQELLAQESALSGQLASEQSR